MNVLNISLFVIAAMAIKVPIVWYIYKTIHDVPIPDLDQDGGELVKAEFTPGPHRRGPHSGGPAVSLQPRRGDKGHDEAVPTPRVTSGSSAP